MKDIILFISLSLGFLISEAQNKVTLDTIYANETMNVALFFPEPIRQGITGADNFVFTYNQENQQYFGLLQGTEGAESNLLVINTDGHVYAFIIKYKKAVTKLNYFIEKSQSIEHEKLLKQLEPLKNNIKLHTPENKTEEYKRFCEYLLNLKYDVMASKRKGGMVLKLMGIRYHQDNVYLVLEIKYKSDIDFEIDYLKVFRVANSRKQKASYQKLEQNVIFKYNYTEQLIYNNSYRMIYVLPKFVLANNEKLEFELVELNFGRKYSLVR